MLHFCCRHAFAEIRVDGFVRPRLQPALRMRDGGAVRLSWWTDLEYADREALGLYSIRLKCDRTERRFVPMTTETIVPWVEYARRVDPDSRARLEMTGMPMHWFVSESPVPVVTEMPDPLAVSRERYGVKVGSRRRRHREA